MNAQILQTLFSLLFVISLIVCTAYLYQRFFLKKLNRSPLLEIKSSLTVGIKEKLLIVECGGKSFLLGVTGQSIQLLHQFDQPIGEGLKKPELEN